VVHQRIFINVSISSASSPILPTILSPSPPPHSPPSSYSPGIPSPTSTLDPFLPSSRTITCIFRAPLALSNRFLVSASTRELGVGGDAVDVDFDRIMNGMARGGGPVGWRRGAGLWETPGQGEMRRVDATMG